MSFVSNESLYFRVAKPNLRKAWVEALEMVFPLTHFNTFSIIIYMYKHARIYNVSFIMCAMYVSAIITLGKVIHVCLKACCIYTWATICVWSHSCLYVHILHVCVMCNAVYTPESA